MIYLSILFVLISIGGAFTIGWFGFKGMVILPIVVLGLLWYAVLILWRRAIWLR